MKLTLGSITIDLDKVSSTRQIGARLLRVHFVTCNAIEVVCGVLDKTPCLICYTGTSAELKMRIDGYITQRAQEILATSSEK